MQNNKLGKMTSIERGIHSIFPTVFANMSSVNLSYKDELSLVNKHLKSLYGENNVNWEQVIENYKNSNDCHIANSINDIPEISLDEIKSIIREENNFANKGKEFLSYFSEEREKERTTQKLISISKELGTYPGNDNAMMSRLVDFKNLKPELAKNTALLEIVTSLLVDSFNSGIQYTYPIIETAMTQPKTKYFYRGENAYYGTSKPGLYRTRNNRTRKNNLPKEFESLINIMRIHTGCSLLDEFDAVNKWGYSNVNYMALVQHYGLKTMMIDITGDIKTALFFACCKYGKDNKWTPLEKSDFAKPDSRKEIYDIGGDSRYAVLYFCPTEIQDMALFCNETGENIVLPVGYQPFMRCKNQYAYMYLTQDSSYDMLKDPMFVKRKIRLTEELCNWIYEEMEQGDKIYPNKDIPDISRYFNEINNTHYFSRKIFEMCFENNEEYDKKALEDIELVLNKYGYFIVEGNKNYIPANKLNKINRKYPVEKAFEYTKVTPVSRPMLII